MDSILQEFINNTVKICKSYSNIIEDDIDSTGSSCFEFADTFVYLFSKNDIRSDIVRYELESKSGQMHSVIIYNESVYEMLDGVLYTTRYIDDKELISNSNKIANDDFVISDMSHYTIDEYENIKCRYNVIKNDF